MLGHIENDSSRDILSELVSKRNFSSKRNLRFRVRNLSSQKSVAHFDINIVSLTSVVVDDPKNMPHHGFSDKLERMTEINFQTP